MKTNSHFLITAIFAVAITFTPAAFAQPTDITSKFTDQNFREAVCSAISKPDGCTINEEDVNAITSLNISWSDIASLAGIEYFTALTTLHVGGNQLTEIDLSKNTALTWLDVGLNRLTSLDLSKNTTLTELYVNNNQLTSIDVSKNTALIELAVNNNQLTSIDVSKNTTLEFLDVVGNQLTSIDVSKNAALETLDVGANQLSELDLSKNTALTWLGVAHNQLSSIDLSKNTALTTLYVNNNQLTSIDVSKSTMLTQMYLFNNQLSSIDVSKNIELVLLDVRNNRLTTLDVSDLSNLSFLMCDYNYLSSVTGYDNYIGPQLPQGFIAATNIYDLPSSATIGTPLTLTGTAFPSDATNKIITEWGIDGDDYDNTGAEINGNVFTAERPGNVWIYAVIKNGSADGKDFKHYFRILVKEADKTPIRLPQIANASNISVQAMGNNIVLQNLPAGAKVEVYGLNGKLVYSNRVNPLIGGNGVQTIAIQTKGMYIVKVSFGSEKKILRVTVK
jgi:Leucine-rich repeat (LRR) protein